MTLVPEFTFGSLVLTDAPFSVEFGADLGNAEDVVSIMSSLLADGEIELTDRMSNRTLQIPLMIDDSDLLALAEAEELLADECLKFRNTLTIDPGDGIAPPTVYDTFRGQVTFKRDDEEEQNGVRRFVLTIRALPFGRSVGKIIDTAGTPPNSGGTVFANCESTTGWAAFDQGSGGGWVAPSFSVDSTVFSEGAGSLKSLMTQWYAGSVDTSYGGGGLLSPAQGDSRDQITGLSLSTGTGGYLTVAYRGDPANTTTLTGVWVSTTSGVWTQVPTWTTTKRDANGFVHIAWAVQGGLTVLGLRFQVHQKRNTDHVPRPYTWYDDFELLPSATTDHQIVKQLDVKGSARTTASLHIAAPGDSIALGQVLAITAPTNELPDGFQPDGARWAVQGTVTADSTALHGQYYTPSTSTYDSGAGKPIFDVPVGMLTAGPYMMVALVKPSTSTLNFGVQARLRYGTTDTGPLSTAEITTPTTANVWQFVTVGTAYLPPLPMQSADTTAKVRLLFKGAVFSDVYMVPAWQVGGRTVADFSIVDCGSGTVAAGGASSNLWIDSPSVDQPQGGWWRGPTADRLNTQSAWPDAKKPGIHTFNPGPLSAFLVSTGAQGPTLALEYFPAWLTNAAL